MTRQRTLGLGDIDIIGQGFVNAQSSLLSSDASNISPVADAFGRRRVSNPLTLFDSKQLYDNSPLFFDDAEVSGSGTGSSHSANRASTTLTVSNATAGKRVRQTFRRFNYQPAKSQLVFCTFVLGQATTGITRRVGYFDENNGLFLEQDSSGCYFVIRSNTTGSPVDRRVALSDSNLNPTPLSSQDFTKTQILVIDFEWLGVGSVRFGFVVDGVIYYYHSFYNANNLDVVYMSTPNLPIRYEIDNDGTGAAASLEHICASVISEGGLQETGITRTAGREQTAFSITTNNVWVPLISIRLKSTHLGATVLPIAISEVYVGASIYDMALFIEPTIGGVDGASWTSVPNSAVEFDISRDETNVLTNGTDIFGQVKEQTNQGIPLPFPAKNLLAIGSQIDGTPQELVVATKKYTGSNTSIYARIDWRELI